MQHWYICKNQSLRRGGQEVYYSAMIIPTLQIHRIPLYFAQRSQNSFAYLAYPLILLTWQTSSELRWKGYSHDHADIPSDRQMLAGRILGQQSVVDRHLCSTSCAHLVLNYPWHTSFHLSSQILLSWAGRESSTLRTHILHRFSLAFSVNLKKQSNHKAFQNNFFPSFLSVTIKKNTPRKQSTVDKVIRFY